MLVCLVHGTFASEAPWANPEGLFHRTLAREMPDAAVDRFNWSGRNSHEARAAAGVELAEHSAALLEAHSRERLLLVGHSHGGNVILQSLKDPHFQSRVDAIVFLGTPFWRVEPRDVATFARAFSRAVAWFVVVPGIMPFGLFLAMGLSSLLFREELAAAGLAFLITLPALALYTWFLRPRVSQGVERRVARALYKKQRQFLQLVSTPVPRCRTFIAAVRGDEAGFVLSFVDALTAPGWGLIAKIARSFWPAVTTLIACVFVSILVDDTLNELQIGWYITLGLLALFFILVTAPLPVSWLVVSCGAAGSRLAAKTHRRLPVSAYARLRCLIGNRKREACGGFLIRPSQSGGGTGSTRSSGDIPSSTPIQRW
ncbi:MAG: alpha/beta hydrolase [Pseudomonadota bacterium]|nr:alpha/beta hydrolase [Pseudomonadota bacterium]